MRIPPPFKGIVGRAIAAAIADFAIAGYLRLLRRIFSGLP
jgi:hypothetical protein